MRTTSEVLKKITQNTNLLIHYTDIKYIILITYELLETSFDTY